MKIPGIAKWARHAGGTAGGGKYGYTFTTGPWPAPQFHISPYTSERGRFMGYLLQITPGKYGLWERIGTYRSPQEAAKIAAIYWVQSGGLENPLTRPETRLVREEAALHSTLGRRSGRPPSESAYYRGMGAGMSDIADEYGTNPPNWERCGYCLTDVPAPAFAPGPEHLPGCPRYRAPEKRRRKTIGRKAASNPPCVKVYERIEEIVARKGPGHRCDAACRAAGHMYRHKFSRRHNAGVFGNSDGSLTIKSV